MPIQSGAVMLKVPHRMTRKPDMRRAGTPTTLMMMIRVAASEKGRPMTWTAKEPIWEEGCC